MNPPLPAAVLWAPRAWLRGRWAEGVRLDVDTRGRLAAVVPGTAAPPPGATVLPGSVLPGLVNAHSHAFQRAFVGLAERREAAHDDFWSWRERMYGVALRIGPEALFVVARQLYRELLAGGYTQVVEFHYLHHHEDGRPYAEPATLARALADAAVEAGIGLTILPALYERAGFAERGLRTEQRRFAAGVEQVLALRDAVRGFALPGVTAGSAVHSLRAATPGAVRALAAAVADDPAPIHVHVAEQRAEVQGCLAATGMRPIEWLLAAGLPDARWQLVHATHATGAEIAGVAACGAGVVLCPSTEANLGDGLADLPRWLAAGVPLSLGSDSQVVRAWPEELRWLEGGQRLRLEQRNVAADPPATPASAARLFGRMLAGGAAAGGLGPSGLVAGARADLLVLDDGEGPRGSATPDPVLAGTPPTHRLDALVFGAAMRPFRQVWVAGRPAPGFGGDGGDAHDGPGGAAASGGSAGTAALTAAFTTTMRALHAAG